jgi:preprotein translocase subunit SecE
MSAGTIDHAKLAAGLACVAAGLVAFYWLSSQALALRVLVVIVGFVAGGAVAATSAQGQQFARFARESWSETRRVIWPDRKETVQMTLTVFGFVVLVAIFLWIVDKSLEWVLYDLILGWKN